MTAVPEGKKSLGAHPYVFPMPVYMISTYCEDDKVDCMAAAWGGICGEKHICICLDESHKTAANIKKRQAFTISIPDVAHMPQADYLGVATANKVENKFEKCGLHAVKSTKVDAPIVMEFPITLECKLLTTSNVTDDFVVIGEIVDVLADESVLGEDGKVDASKINTYAFDTFHHNYYGIGGVVGKAFREGQPYLKKQ